MAFALTIDGQRWREQLDATCEAVERAAGSPIVPVIKGNGYGIGQRILAEQALRLGVDTVAVGTVFEVDEVAEYGNYDIVVLEPFEPRDSFTADAWWRLGQQLHAGRVIRTIGSREALLALADGPGTVRVLLEAQTSMHRFGFDEAELLRVLADADVRHAFAPGQGPRRGARPPPAAGPAGRRCRPAACLARHRPGAGGRAVGRAVAGRDRGLARPQLPGRPGVGLASRRRRDDCSSAGGA